MTVKEKALLWTRKQKGNVLNNKNVDCFIADYNIAAEEYRKVINKLKEQLENNEIGLGYSGYMYSYLEWCERKKSAYIALCGALKQCEEFIDNIKSLL